MALFNNKTGRSIIAGIRSYFFSIFALIVSFFSAYFSIKSYRETVTQKAIDDTYRTFYEISVTVMNNSDLLHLYEMPETYQGVIKDIHLSLMPITEKKRAEYSLKERAFASYIFGFYENILLQHRESLKDRNTDRTIFLEGVLHHFRTRVLINPRLLYLWNSNGGKLSLNYSKLTTNDYAMNVLNNKGSSLAIIVDSVGPYFIDTIKVAR